jgi:hypothetical protein
MIWIDRLAVVWAIVVFAGVAAMEMTLPTAARFGPYFPGEVVVVVGLLAGVPWAIARAMRWAFRRNRNGFTYRVHPL